MKINHAQVSALIGAVRHDALSPFAEEIKKDMVDGTPRNRQPGRGRPHTPLWMRTRIERTETSQLIGSDAPYQSVAEFTMRRDGTYSWRDKSRIFFMKRALYQHRNVGPR